MVGRTILHYRILERLGKGGMGEVWKAEDLELRRIVALKFLTADVVAVDEVRARLIREAQAAASLDHPNINTIYAIHEERDEMFIAMAFVDGPSLAERINDRPLPLNDVLEIAAQIAGGLQEAHEKGVVHRDIKPRNIMLTAKGQVKITDFGLASLTGGSKITARGVIVGTLDYMAPEQLEARQVDNRTDIWALGCVLYEMLTQRVPFEAEYEQAITYGILNEQPEPVTALRSGVPLEIDNLVDKTLAKAPEHRYQHTGDLLVDLRRLRISVQTREHPKSGAADQTCGELPKLKKKLRNAFGVGALVAVAFGVGVAVNVLPTPWANGDHATLLTDGVSPNTPASLTSYPGDELEPVFSPDGRLLAFTWTGEDGRDFDLYVKNIDDGSLIQVTADPAREHSPTFSSDGRKIAYLRQIRRDRHRLIVTSIDGLTHQELTELHAEGVGFGISWEPGDQRIAVVDRRPGDSGNQLYLFDMARSDFQRVSPRSPGDVQDAFPRFSRDGTRLAFVRSVRDSTHEIHVVSMEDSEEAVYQADTFSGLDWSADDRSLVFASPHGELGGSLCRLDTVTGMIERLNVGSSSALYPAIPADRSGVAYARRQSDSNIWSYRLVDGVAVGPARRVIDTTRPDDSPEFSPNGDMIAYSSALPKSYEIWVSLRNGTDPRPLTSFGSSLAGSPAWSPDSERLAFDYREENHADIYVVDSSGGYPIRLTTSLAEDYLPVWSPDGAFIYFSSDRGGTNRIYRIQADGGPVEPVTQIGGFESAFGPSGRSLYFTRSPGETGVWRHDFETGREDLVNGLERAGHPRYWAIGGDGLYFVEDDPSASTGRVRRSSQVWRYDLQTGAVTKTAIIPQGLVGGPSGLAVAPDESSLLFVQLDYRNTDIVIVGQR